MAAELRTITDENIFDNDEYWRETRNNMVNTIRMDSVTLHIHKTTNTLGMMGRVKAYLMIQNVNIEDYMDESSRSVEKISIADIQDDYTTEDVIRLRQRFPTRPPEDEDDYV
eukprot:3841622-Amphidinium_carterae.1